MRLVRPLFLALALGLPAPSPAQDMPVATVVLFDAVCLTCHEGECSGRMALRTERSTGGLAGHVTGYAGPQDDGTVARLKALMERLKTECRLPAPPVDRPAAGRWTAAELAPLTLPDRLKMFIPLGRLEPGRRSASLGLDPPQRLRLQVVAANFDILFDQDVALDREPVRIHWQVEEAETHFLRIIARQPLGTLQVAP